MPGDTCPGVDVTPDGAAVSLPVTSFDNFSDYGTPCGSVRPRDGYRDWVYHFRLATARDVVVTMSGGGSTMHMQLESACGGTTIGGCRSGSMITQTYRGLTAGDYYVLGENSDGTGPVQARVTTMAPGTRTAGDVCPGVDVRTDGTAVTLDTSSFDAVADYGTTCGSAGAHDTWRDWVYHFRLASASDVTVTARDLTPGAFGYDHFQLQSTCGASTTPIGGCVDFSTSGTSRRYRGLAAGDYYVIGEGMLPDATSNSLSVTATAPGTRLTGDVCASAVPITPDGAAATITLAGFDSNADYGTTCGSGPDGSGYTDWVFSYTLATARDVTVRTTSSTSATLHMMVESTCGAQGSAVGSCVTGTSSVLRRIPRQPAGTYYVVGEALTVPSSVSATVTTAAPGTFVTYVRGTPPLSVTWVDACAATGHSTILPNVDDSDVLVPLPFAFTYWGTAIASGSMVDVSSNGTIALNGVAGHAYTGTIPSTATPNSTVAPYWGDLHTRDAGMCVATVGTMPNRQWVVEWNDAYYYGTSGMSEHLTFEAILNETSNTLDFLYNTMSMVRTETIGVENQDGTDGVVVCNQGDASCSITAGTRIRFTPSM